MAKKKAEDPGRGEGRGEDEEKEQLLRRIHEFLRHGMPAEEDEVEEWGEFASQLRYLQEELSPEERAAVLSRWETIVRHALPDLALPPAQKEMLLLALEAAAAEGAAWASLEREAPASPPSERTAVIRVEWWALEADHETGAIFLDVGDRRTDAHFELADPLVLAHLASDLKGLLRDGGPWVPPELPPAEGELPSVRLSAVAGYCCGAFEYAGFRAVSIQAAREGEVYALCLFQPDQARDLLARAREILRER